MANRVIDSYVKWVAGNQELIGQVKTVNANDTIVSLPLNQLATVSNDRLADATEDEYKKLIQAAYDKLQKQLNKEDTMTVTQAELDKANETVKTLEAKIAELNTIVKANEVEIEEAKKSKAEMTKMQEKMAKCETELAEIKKAAATEARFNEFKALSAIETIDVDAAKAKEKLGGMSESEYSLAKNMATSFQKTTEQYQTSLKKLTDQTVTKETKLTEAETKLAAEAKAKEEAEAAAKAVTEATKEKVEDNLGTAAANTKESPAFKDAMAKLVTRKSKKITKDKE